MLNDLLETGKAECEAKTADGCNSSTACIDERLRDCQRNVQEYDSGSCREIVTLIKDNVRYEIYSVYHGPDPMTWLHSQHRLDIAMEADKAYIHPSSPVFVEESLLPCKKAMILKDIQYAEADFKTLKTNKHIGDKEASKGSMQEDIDFLEKMKGYYAATYEIIRATTPQSFELFEQSLEFYLAYFSKAGILPPPLGMENNLLYIQSCLKNLGKNNPKVEYLYVGLTPARSAYMAQRLQDAAKHQAVKQVKLYCGIAHANEVLFLLKNPDYIDRYLVSPPKESMASVDQTSNAIS